MGSLHHSRSNTVPRVPQYGATTRAYPVGGKGVPDEQRADQSRAERRKPLSNPHWGLCEPLATAGLASLISFWPVVFCHTEENVAKSVENAHTVTLAPACLRQCVVLRSPGIGLRPGAWSRDSASRLPEALDSYSRCINWLFPTRFCGTVLPEYLPAPNSGSFCKGGGEKNANFAELTLTTCSSHGDCRVVDN